MSKKYLSVEEAADMLGLTTSEVLRAREQDKIRGFADRGTWKFKAEDIENYQRETSRGEVPAEDVLSDDDVLSEQPTVIRKGEPSSDSDVRLIYSGTPGGSDAPLVPDSDSDVRLAGSQKSALDSSDSDVKLVQEDKSVSDDRSVSDVRLTPLESGEMAATGSKFGSSVSDSDSDVKLVGRAGSSAEMLVKPGSSGNLLKGDSGKLKGDSGKLKGDSGKLKSAQSGTGADETIDFTPDESSVLDDSGIDSGISLVGDSGISLESPQDSGISLEKGDSGISLSSDSGMNLAHDSGISLDITSDSGISLSESSEEPQKPAARAGKSPKRGQTSPMLDIPLAGENLSDTNMEVPLLDDEDSKDSSYDLADSHDTTSVVTLDEDSEEFIETVVKKPASSSDALEDAVFEDESEEVEVADELGEDAELDDLDAFGAADEDFDDSFQTGESHHELEVAPRAAAHVEHEWGGGVFATLCVTSFLMLIAGTVAFDLLQGLWHADVENRNPLGGLVLSILGPMFGG